MRSITRQMVLLFVFMLVAGYSYSADEKKIPSGAKVYLTPMGGFEENLRTAFTSKKVPLKIVDKREEADFEISGSAETQKASTAKKIILGSWHSSEQASIRVSDIKTGEVVYAYSYSNNNSAHGRKSSAESCAKHIKEQIK